MTQDLKQTASDAGRAAEDLGQPDAGSRRTQGGSGGNGDRDARAEVEGTPVASGKPATNRQPAAGTHADPKLQNPEATPGAGTLTPSGGHDDTDATSG